MKRLLGLAVMAAMALLVWGAETATPAKKAPVKSGASKTAAGKRPASKTGAKKGAATAPARKASAKKQTTWRNRQLTPTPERYKDIQSALAAKGYLASEEANGAWNQSSIDALKRFQTEQNLEPTGKINSLSLIALGLGPKRETVAAAAPAPVPVK